MKRRYVLAAIAVATFAFAGPAAAQTKLKFAHVYETNEPYHTEAVWAAGEIAKRTNNKYQVDVFPASALGNEQQINQALPLGTIDMIYTGAAFAGATFKPIAISNAPYMFQNFDHWKAYADSPLFKELADGYDKASNNKILALTYYGARHTTANKAIMTPADTKGMKLRAAGAALSHVHQGDRRQRVPHRLRRGLPGAPAEDGRRPGEPVADHPGEEVLRGADPHQSDRAHLREPGHGGQRAVMGPPLGA